MYATNTNPRNKNIDSSLLNITLSNIPNPRAGIILPAADNPANTQAGNLLVNCSPTAEPASKPTRTITANNIANNLNSNMATVDEVNEYLGI